MNRDRAIKQSGILLIVGAALIAAMIVSTTLNVMPLTVGLCIAAIAAFHAASIVCVKAGA